MYRLSKDEEYRVQVIVATRKEIDNNYRGSRDRAYGVLKEWKQSLDKAKPI